MNTSTIRTRLLLPVLALSVPLAAIVGYGSYQDMRETVAHTTTGLRTLVSMMVSNTGGKIAHARQVLERLVSRPLVQQPASI